MTSEEKTLWSRLPLELQRQATEMGFDDAKKVRFAVDFDSCVTAAKEKRTHGLNLSVQEANALSIATRTDGGGGGIRTGKVFG